MYICILDDENVYYFNTDQMDHRLVKQTQCADNLKKGCIYAYPCKIHVSQMICLFLIYTEKM